MAVPDRPLRADAQRNRDKVLRAAHDLFATGGFEVSVDDIASRADVGPGTVYRHFPAKEALFQAVVTTRISDLVADAQERARHADPGEAFFGFLTRLAAEAEAKRDLPHALSVPGPLRDDLHAALTVLLVAARDAGHVRPGVTTSDLLALLKGLLTSAGDAPDAGQTARLTAIVVDGLRPPRPVLDLAAASP